MQRKIRAKGVLAAIVLLCCSFMIYGSAYQAGQFDYAFKCLADTCICVVTAQTSEPPITLPNTSMTIGENKLPSRMSFLLADVSAFVPLFTTTASNGGSLLSRIIGTTSNLVKSPLETLIIKYLESQGYKTGESRVSGFLNFFYTSEISLDTLISTIMSSMPLEGVITAQLDVVIFSSHLSPEGLAIRGDFIVKMPEINIITIVPKGDFYINDELYTSPGWSYKINS